MNEGELYVQLLMMPQLNHKDTDWLEEEGYFYLDSGVYYSTKKADDFMASYEGPLIKKILEAFKKKDTISWEDIRKITALDQHAVPYFIGRLTRIHELLIEQPGHMYILRKGDRVE